MKKSLYLSAIALAATMLTAQANIIPSLNPVTPAATVGGFLWNYSVNVTVDQLVKPGDYFTIYDFGNFNAASNLQPAGWVFSSALTGVTPGLVLPTDDPTLLNLTWTYEGETPITGAAALGDFSVVASQDQLRNSDFAAEATRNGGPNDGTKVDNVGMIAVPVPEMSALLPIISVCGAGLVAGIPGFLRRRKNG